MVTKTAMMATTTMMMTAQLSYEQATTDKEELSESADPSYGEPTRQEAKPLHIARDTTIKLWNHGVADIPHESIGKSERAGFPAVPQVLVYLG